MQTNASLSSHYQPSDWLESETYNLNCVGESAHTSTHPNPNPSFVS